jgi:uncharacterized protein YkwD
MQLATETRPERAAGSMRVKWGRGDSSMRYAAMVIAMAATLSPAFAQVKPATPAARKAEAKAIRAKPSATARLAPSKDEQAIFDSANRERAARKLPPLKWNAGLASAARGHAQKMAQAGALSHQFSGEADMGMRIRVAGVRFASVAENVAQGPSAAVLHQEWMNSPAHRENILDPGLDSLGVAVVERNRELFAVQDFALVSQ